MARLENATVYSQMIQASLTFQDELQAFLAEKPEHLLAQRPQPNKWSFLECINHLSLTYKDYLPRVKQAIEEGKTVKGTHFNQGFFGRMMINSMTPKEGKIKLKVKTLGKFIPPPESAPDFSILDTFLEQHQEFIKLLEAATPLHGGKIRLNSAIGSVLRFRLGDCCQFLVGHNERHWLQAQQAYEAVASVDRDQALSFL